MQASLVIGEEFVELCNAMRYTSEMANNAVSTPFFVSLGPLH